MAANAAKQEEGNPLSIRSYPTLPVGWEDRSLAEKGGVLYCQWRGETPARFRLDPQSAWALGGVIFFAGCFEYAMRWVAMGLRTSHAPLASFVLIILIALAVVGYAIFRNTNQVRKEEESAYEARKRARPADAPERAIPATVSMMCEGGKEGESQGWLWLDEPWLNFVGDRFDFRLRQSDLRPHTRRSLAPGAPLSLPLAAPEGSPVRSIVVTSNASEPIEIQREIVGWKTADIAESQSLYPPLQPPGVLPEPSYVRRYLVGAAGLYYLGRLFAMLMLPDYGDSRMPDLLASSVVGAMILFAFGTYALLQRRKGDRSK